MADLGLLSPSLPSICPLPQTLGDAHALDRSASMGKPSRRRGPLLRLLPLRLPHPRLTRFILSHPRPLPLRMGEKGRQIRRSARMGNSSKLKRGRSRVIPRRTQTLTNFEATHRDPLPRPPLDLLNFPDEFKSLPTDRLLPCDFNNTSSSAMQQYDAYLQWFYSSHTVPDPVASLADTASKYLKKENKMTSLWVNSHACCNVPDSVLGDCIVSYMKRVIKEKGEIEHPFAFDAAECLTKETELICEWLRCGRRIFTDDEYTLCHKIRVAAAELFITRRKSSFHIYAALVGIRKEAEWLIENLKNNSSESINTSMKIRQFALDFLWKKFNELEPCYTWGNQELSETKMAVSDNDDDADNYMGSCYDEDYMKLYR